MARHSNKAPCLKCNEIMNRYHGLDLNLRTWFIMMQSKFPDLHVSCAGRGIDQQTRDYLAGASKAKFGESAHNYNAAIDLFRLVKNMTNYNVTWFIENIGPEVPSYLEWYGWLEYKTRKDKFWELPHIELKGWRDLRDKGLLVLVETPIVGTA